MQSSGSRQIQRGDKNRHAHRNADNAGIQQNFADLHCLVIAAHIHIAPCPQDDIKHRQIHRCIQRSFPGSGRINECLRQRQRKEAGIGKNSRKAHDPAAVFIRKAKDSAYCQNHSHMHNCSNKSHQTDVFQHLQQFFSGIQGCAEGINDHARCHKIHHDITDAFVGSLRQHSFALADKAHHNNQKQQHDFFCYCQKIC